MFCGWARETAASDGPVRWLELTLITFGLIANFDTQFSVQLDLLRSRWRLHVRTSSFR